MTRSASVQTKLRSEADISRQCEDLIKMFDLDIHRQNVAVFTNPKGQRVRCGEPGDTDYGGVLPDGRAIHLEIKWEGFDPRRVPKADRERWGKQLERMRKTNAQGGVGFWVRDVEDLRATLQRLFLGWRIEINEDGFCERVSPDEECA